MRVTTLLVGCILLLMLGSTAGQKMTAQNAPRPLSAGDVEHGLRSGVPNARMTVLVKRYGVDFELNDAVEKQLRSAGASDNLILQIGRARVRVDRNSAKTLTRSAVGTHKHQSANMRRSHAPTTAKEILQKADKYRLGSGMDRDEAQAARLYRTAAEMGNAEAQTRFADRKSVV